MKAKPQDLIVYIAAAVLVVTAAAYHLRKWNNTTLDISQSELNGLCQSVTGCESAKLGWAADRKQSTISLKATIVASKKNKNTGTEEPVEQSVRQLVESKQTWLDAGLDNLKVEVRYE